MFAALERPDILVADHALPIDDEGLRHAGRAERDLNARFAYRVRCARKDRRCARGKSATSSGVSRTAIASIAHAASLQALQHRRFADARHAPAGEDVEELRLARREVREARPGLSAGGRQA